MIKRKHDGRLPCVCMVIIGSTGAGRRLPGGGVLVYRIHPTLFRNRASLTAKGSESGTVPIAPPTIGPRAGAGKGQLANGGTGGFDPTVS